jgi:hypothetical protein
MFGFLFCTFFFLFCVFRVFVLFYVLFLPMYIVFIFYLCKILPTVAAGWKPNHISYHITIVSYLPYHIITYQKLEKLHAL